MLSKILIGSRSLSIITLVGAISGYFLCPPSMRWIIFGIGSGVAFISSAVTVAFYVKEKFFKKQEDFYPTAYVSDSLSGSNYGSCNSLLHPMPYIADSSEFRCQQYASELYEQLCDAIEIHPRNTEECLRQVRLLRGQSCEDEKIRAYLNRYPCLNPLNQQIISVNQFMDYLIDILSNSMGNDQQSTIAAVNSDEFCVAVGEVSSPEDDNRILLPEESRKSAKKNYGSAFYESESDQYYSDENNNIEDYIRISI